MAACDVTLVSPSGDAVTIPAASAWKHIGLLQRLVELDGGSRLEMPPIELGFSIEVLRVVADYMGNANRSPIRIPKPLSGALKDFVPSWDLDFVRNVEGRDMLIPLFECACFLCVAELRDLLSAFVTERVNDIAKEAPSIMEGAMRLRTYLQLENEWTEEESECLEQEMQHAKRVDSRGGTRQKLMRIFRIQFFPRSEGDAPLELQVTVASFVLAVIVFLCVWYAKHVCRCVPPAEDELLSTGKGSRGNERSSIGLLMLFPQLPPLSRVTTKLDRHLSVVLQRELEGGQVSIGPMAYKEHEVVLEMFRNSTCTSASSRAARLSLRRVEQSSPAQGEMARLPLSTAVLGPGFKAQVQRGSSPPTARGGVAIASSGGVQCETATPGDVAAALQTPDTTLDSHQGSFSSSNNASGSYDEPGTVQGVAAGGSGWKWLVQQKVVQLMSAPEPPYTARGICDVQYIKVRMGRDEEQGKEGSKGCGGILLRARCRTLTSSALLHAALKCGLIQTVDMTSHGLCSSSDSDGDDNIGEGGVHHSLAERGRCPNVSVEHRGQRSNDPHVQEQRGVIFCVPRTRPPTERVLHRLVSITSTLLHALHTIGTSLIWCLIQNDERNKTDDTINGEARLFISPFCSKFLLQSVADRMNKWTGPQGTGDPKVGVSDVAAALLLGALRRQRAGDLRQLHPSQCTRRTNKGTLLEVLSQALSGWCAWLEQCYTVCQYFTDDAQLEDRCIRCWSCSDACDTTTDTIFATAVDAQKSNERGFHGEGASSANAWVERVLRCTECRMQAIGAYREHLWGSVDIVTYLGIQRRNLSYYFCCEQTEAIYCIESPRSAQTVVPWVRPPPPALRHTITECGDALQQSVWLPSGECTGQEFLRALADELLVITNSVLGMHADDVMKVLRVTHRE